MENKDDSTREFNDLSAAKKQQYEAEFRNLSTADRRKLEQEFNKLSVTEKQKYESDFNQLSAEEKREFEADSSKYLEQYQQVFCCMRDSCTIALYILPDARSRCIPLCAPLRLPAPNSLCLHSPRNCGHVYTV